MSEKRSPSRHEGGIGAIMGIGSLMVQGVFFVSAVQHADDWRWYLWAVVLVSVVCVDVIIVRALLRRR